MTVYVRGGDGHPNHYQPRHCHCRVTWVLPGSPSADAAAAAASAVPIATTTERMGVTKMKHRHVIDIIQSKYHKHKKKTKLSVREESVEQKL